MKLDGFYERTDKSKTITKTKKYTLYYNIVIHKFKNSKICT